MPRRVELLDLDRAAHVACVSRRTIEKAIAAGELREARPGMVAAHVLMTWLHARARQPLLTR